MKIFLSHSSKDREFVDKLAAALKAADHEPLDKTTVKVGDNIIEKVTQAPIQPDRIIVVLSEASNKSARVQQEWSAFAMREVSTNKNIILPALLETCEIPIFLQDRSYADFRISFDEGLRQLQAALRQTRGTKAKREEAKDEVTKENKETALDIQLSKIKTEYLNGNLTLFCGAGISKDAGIPPWTLLLNSLLTDLLQKKVDNKNRSQDKLAELYREYFNPAPLMIAQYLKDFMGKDFLERVRTALYKNNLSSSALITAIVDLCRPQRARSPLGSIITFNFDDLLEENLSTNKIKFKSIFKEGQRCAPVQLPIYHAHGFLPRSGNLSKDHEVVFSEDAYHSQFIDSFSWSNLIQLNHLSQNLCLFIGLSMTDPNLRRLLDVSMRKNPDRALNHYVFKCRYDRSTITPYMAKLGIKDKDNQYSDDLMKVAEVLEEQDANNLGLNVIWVDQYSEIPAVLKKLA